MDVTRVTRLVYCPRCQGALWPDSLGLAPYWCLWCSERYDTALVPLRRSPTALEMSKKYRAAYAHHEARM